MGKATGPNPKKRNKNAGKSTGTSATSVWNRANPTKAKANRAKEAKKQTPSTKEGRRRSKNRVESTAAQRKNPSPKGYDKSHTKKGTLVNEKRAKNRARNGKNGKSTKK